MNITNGAFCQHVTIEDFRALPCKRLENYTRKRETAVALPLGDFISACQGDTRAKQVAREAAACGDKNRLKAAKDKTPAWGFPERIIQLDLDHATDAERIKDALKREPAIAMAAISLSGRGVFALAYTEDRERGLCTLRQVAERLKAAGLQFDFDTSCERPTQTRVETYDPELYIAQEIRPAEGGFTPSKDESATQAPEPEPLTKAFTEAWSRHAVARLARAYQANASDPGGIASAAAITTVAALADVKIDDDGDIYAARWQCVVLAQSGAGKTTIDNLLASVCQAYGVAYTNPKTTAALRQAIRNAGTNREKTSAGEVIESAREYARSVIASVDEGGDAMNARTRDPHGLDLRSFMRRLFGGVINLDGLKNEPEMVVPTHFTSIIWSTPSQYARYASAINSIDGERRRVLEFWVPDEPNNWMPLEGRKKRHARRGDGVALHDYAERITAAWHTPGAKIKVTEYTYEALIPIYHRFLRAGMGEGEAITLILNTSAILAAARIALEGATGHEITPDDVLAASAVLERLQGARAALEGLQERESDRAYKPASAIWSDIRDFIEKSGGKPRTDVIVRWLSKREPEYRKTYDGMIQRGELIKERIDAKKTAIRFATPAELEHADELRERATEDKSPQGGGRAWGDQSMDEKRRRFERYIQEFERSNAMTEGRRNETLHLLAVRLENAGMLDQDGLAWLEDYAVQFAKNAAEKREYRATIQSVKKNLPKR